MALQADSAGKVSGRFTIPANVPVGAKLVEFQGRGGGKARATFVGRGQISVTELRQVQTITTITSNLVERYDPLAETFTLGEAALISGVDLWFTKKGATGRTFVEIREASNGVPNQTVLAQFVVATASLLLNQWHRFSWAPIRLEAGREYAIVVGCDDAVTSAAVAELGKFDASAQKWVTEQPYQIGVLLSSSNASTWTPHQTKDLTFRLLATPVAATTAVIPLPNVTITNADELVVLAAVERPTADCDCVFQLSLPDGSTITVAEGERVVLPQVMTGTVQWSALLTGSPTASPRLHRDVELVYGQRAASATYITRSLPAGAGSKVSVYFEAITPGASGVVVEVSANGTSGWQSVPYLSGTPIGDGWVDLTYRLSSYSGQTAVIRLTLSGNARARPEVRKLRVVVT